ncbi:MAG: HIT family protein [Promethearchaeota archaeon]|nr:MAG: HIT family protein [Candidatus Lokiarchaeota archaeon]
MHDENCIFCKIVQGLIPSSKIYEDGSSLAFLDIAPFTKGHTIVIPKEHYMNMLDFPEKEMTAYFSAVKNVTIKIKEKLGADGINIMQNNFKAAGQVVNHLHFHVIPRWENDRAFPIRVKKLNLTKEELSEILLKINAP